MTEEITSVSLVGGLDLKTIDIRLSSTGAFMPNQTGCNKVLCFLSF